MSGDETREPEVRPAALDELDEHRLRRIVGAGRALVSRLDLETVLSEALDVARDLTGARFAALGILDEDRRRLERFITVGIDEAQRRIIGDLPRGHGILGMLIEEPSPLRIHDINEHPRSYGVPPGHPPMRSFLGVPIRVRGEAYGNLYLTEKADGADFDLADEQAVVILAEWAGIAIENARLYERVSARREELERAVRSLESTIEIARVLAGETDLQRVLELIVKRSRALVEARCVAILLAEGPDLVVSAAAGVYPEGLVGARVPREGSAAGDVLASHRPERYATPGPRLLATLRALGDLTAECALFVPLVFRDRSAGVLVALDRHGAEGFDAEDERLMLSFAVSAAAAVATAQTVEREHLRHSLRATEDERRRWARELHDETLQGLGALQVMLSSAARRGEPEVLRDTVREVVGQLGGEIESLRALITELRPAALDQLGLQPAIESLVRRTVDAEGIEIDVVVDLGLERGDQKGRLDAELESTVYRLVQEALTNVTKHARAEHARVAVREDGDAVEIVVEDDGRGFDPGADTSGFGLMGMRERVALSGGRIEISSGEAGTRIEARLPARHVDAAHVAAG